MSYPQDAEDMERPTTAGGSIKRARERAEAGLPREDFAAFARRMAGPETSVASPPRQEEQRQQQLQPQQQPQQQQPEPPQPAKVVPPPLNPRRAAGEPSAGQSKIPRPQGLQTKDGQIGVAISRPTPIPQWPLAGAMAAPAQSSDAEPYRPPPGRSQQPPQRPPRPSRVPSILDSSKVQDHTPVFQYTPQNGRESEVSIPQTTSSSRPSTLSSVGSIPDFPLPVSMPPPAPPRRSVNLGPPPSSRRGASSFYSNASYVSPIPEESPRSRSHASFASSAAMPESWGTPSPGPSPNYPDVFFEDPIPEEGRESAYDEDGDESRLVRSASVGKRGKALLVTTTGRNQENWDARPGPSPVQGGGPFKDGTSYLDASSNSSGTIPTSRAPPAAATGAAATVTTADLIMNAFDAASSTDMSRASMTSPPPSARTYNRLSALRFPLPRLDMDNARRTEARGSATSLTDMIKRATRLAASLERGKRPASRFDDLDFSPRGFRDGEKEMSFEDGKHQSGLSDMLAAFPPPAHQNRRSFRQSLRDQVGSWPLPLAFNGSRGSTTPQMPRGGGLGGGGGGGLAEDTSSEGTDLKRGRRCCGLPMWGFIVVVIIVLILIAAAIIIPIEFFVIRKQSLDAQAQSALAQCQGTLTCANGGTNVVSDQGFFCSCICTNGFTGFDCTVAGANGCTTTNLGGRNSGGDSNNLSNVTLGDAIPRLIQQAQANFSIPLSGTQILAKFNQGNLSCSAENALITFDGQKTRQGDAGSPVVDISAFNAVVAAAANTKPPSVVNGVAIVTVTLIPGVDTTIILNPAPVTATSTPAAAAASQQQFGNGGGGGFSTIVSAPTAAQPTTITPIIVTPTSTSTMTMTRSSTALPPGATFAVTEQVVDFARVAVLFILQQETLQSAETAQNILQRFFTTASQGNLRVGTGVSLSEARNVTLGGGNSINLVNFLLDAGSGLMGSGSSRAVGTKRTGQRDLGFLALDWR